MIYFMDKLMLARQSELAIQSELEHIERLHRIMKLPRRSPEYTAQLAEKLAKLERRLNNTVDLAVDRKNEALNLLDSLAGNERTVLYQYYILAMSWEEVAEKMYMSDRNVYKLRKKAVDKLAAKYLKSDTLSENKKKRASGE